VTRRHNTTSCSTKKEKLVKPSHPHTLKGTIDKIEARFLLSKPSNAITLDIEVDHLKKAATFLSDFQKMHAINLGVRCGFRKAAFFSVASAGYPLEKLLKRKNC
jgi:hypothetical protein